MPRAFSSARRSGSVPVSALTSADLPWSMCPAVPRTSDGAVGSLTVAYSASAAASASTTTASSSADSVRGSISRRSSWMRAMTCGSPRPQARLELRHADAARVAPPRRPWGCRPCGSAPPPARETSSATRPRQRPRRQRRRDARRQRLGAHARSRTAGAVSMRSVGISRSAPARGRGRARSVTSSAASVILSSRSARASGCFLRRAITCALAHEDARLRPAEQLVARARHEVGARRDRRCRRSARPASPYGARSTSTPEPWSSNTGMPWRGAELARARPATTSSVKPTTRKLLECTLSSRPGVGRDARSRSRAGASCWWCRPRPSGRRTRAMMSGMRKQPPISTSWPRLDDRLPARARAPRGRAAPRRRCC